jgi:hypothetical protein
MSYTQWLALLKKETLIRLFGCANCCTAAFFMATSDRISLAIQANAGKSESQIKGSRFRSNKNTFITVATEAGGSLAKNQTSDQGLTILTT